MGCRLTSTEGKTALFDSVSGFAFGPVLGQYEGEDFLEWFQDSHAERFANEHGWVFASAVDLSDPRSFTGVQLEKLYGAFLAEREAVEETA